MRLASKNAGEVTLSGDDLMLLPKLGGTISLRRAGQELGWAEARLRSVVASLDARQMLEAINVNQQPRNATNSGAGNSAVWPLGVEWILAEHSIKSAQTRKADED